jgi:DNA replication and repair protein RecF
MFLEKLRLVSFKNYNHCNLEFNRRVNFLYGDNGNGKTNVLESISMLCYTKSFLQSAETDCVRHSSSGLSISGEFVDRAGSRQIITFRYDKENAVKQILRNGESVRRFSTFFGKIPLVILSPMDARLVSGSPADKRKNFDILICQANRVYFDALKNYNRILLQKNSLLRENAIFKRYASSQLNSLLEPWNESLIGYSVKIIRKRTAFVEEFHEYMERNFRDIAGQTTVPVISYECTVDSNILTDEKDLIAKFRARLEENQKMEIKRGMALIGPHRDRYHFLIPKNGSLFELKTFGSQGEQKTFLTALKLSEYMYLKDKHEDSNAGDPILLLDDLFSELDSNRISNLTSSLPRFNQVFLTSTNHDYLKILKDRFEGADVSAFYIENGTAVLTN